tara:strand:- start:209 stop:376 length:168 start_codon:yes stop_codon:yes gene_type:complete
VDTKHKNAFYKWEFPQYEQAMLQIMSSLRPICFQAREMIALELDEITCVTFIQKG